MKPTPFAEEQDNSQFVRRLSLWPSMCGGSSRLVSQIGDWTWEMSERFCQANPTRAFAPNGDPTYLSFCYIRLKAGAYMDWNDVGIGDEMEVSSRPYRSGPGGLHTVHRLQRLSRPGAERGTGSDKPEQSPPLLTVEEAHESLKDHCLYAETYNRWVSRSDPSSNENLIRAAPSLFQNRNLDDLPRHYRAKRFFQVAQEYGSFYVETGSEETLSLPEPIFLYAIDPTHDVNGVGLLYFASYFAMIDRAFLDAWVTLGGTIREFVSRRVLEQRIVYLGNADFETSLCIHRSLRRIPGENVLIFDASMQRSHDQKTIAIATFWVELGPTQ